MTPKPPGRYNGAVIDRWRRGAVGLILVFACWCLVAAQARADQSVDPGPNPVVNVQLLSGNLTVRTCDCSHVQIQTDGSVQTQQLDDVHPPSEIPIEQESVATDRGTITMPSEAFALPQLPGSRHNAIIARGSGNTTITIPRDTAMVTAHVRRGNLNIQGYHGVFLGSAHKGGIDLEHVSGTGFVEALHGPVTATDSTFDRLRARTTTGDMNFRGCTSHQIQATSTYGSIMYDNGRFQPGLAHFESVHGNVAIGVRGGAQVGAQTQSGHIVSSFRNNVQVQHSGPNAAQATIHGGGPVVTAASHNGSVYLYNGSMRAHPSVQSELREASGIPHFAPPNGAQSSPARRPNAAPEYRPYPQSAPRSYAEPMHRPYAQAPYPPARRLQPQGPPPGQYPPTAEPPHRYGDSIQRAYPQHHKDRRQPPV